MDTVTPLPGRQLVRARLAVSLVFLYFGIVVGTWTSRIPTVKASLGLTDTRLGTALVCFAAGSVAGMLLARLVDRMGTARALGPLALAQAAALALVAVVPDLPVLCGTLGVFGAIQGSLNVTMNAVAVVVQRTYRRRIMSSFHALFSMGGLVGAATGGLAADADISLGHHFLAVLCTAVVPAALAHRWRLRGAHGPEPEAADANDPSGTGKSAPESARERTTRLWLPTALLGCCAMFAMIAEGAVGDWSTVYMHEELGTSVSFASATFVAFSVAMFLARLTGDRVVAALGTRRFVQCSAVLGACCLGAGVVTPLLWLAVAGFAGLGLGLAGLTPQIYTTAGDLTRTGTGRSLSLIIAMGYVGFLIGPALIGFVSGMTNLSVALLIPSVLLLLIPVLVSVLHIGDGEGKPR